MTARRGATSRKKAHKPKPVLGPGLHAATAELTAGDVVRIRTAAGEHCEAIIAPHVERALVEECLRQRKMLVVADTPEGITILGALQTARTISPAPDGTLEIAARDLRLSADRSIVVEVAGGAALRADRSGVVRLEGSRMIVDVSSVVRFLSARVELP